MAAFVAARTAFFDEQLLRACATGNHQVVIVGAGYDGRSLRFRQPNIAFFELDHPATQADKLARLNDPGVDASDVRFVPLDIGCDSPVEALASSRR
jgi:methyltransferase (TIGR00027 family)